MFPFNYIKPPHLGWAVIKIVFFFLAYASEYKVQDIRLKTHFASHDLPFQIRCDIKWGNSYISDVSFGSLVGMNPI